jgi:NAD(P)-dependent dehydrogenase (short-subunit alcohol dehydrogenase family)
MKIVVIGATGTIGKEVVRALENEHDVIRVGNSKGDLVVDMTSTDSIASLFTRTGNFDALICAAGSAKFLSLDEFTSEDYFFGLKNKLMGQVALFLAARKHLNDGGAVTLTSGILSQEPMLKSSSISMINAGLEGFVRAAQLEMTRGTRINCVSPAWVKETMEAMGMDSSPGIPAQETAKVYIESLKDTHRGEILDVRRYL